MFKQVIPEKIQKIVNKIKKIDSRIYKNKKIQDICMCTNEIVLYEFYKTIGNIYNNLKPIQVYYNYSDNQDILYDKEIPFNIIDLEYSEKLNYSEEECWDKHYEKYFN